MKLRYRTAAAVFLVSSGLPFPAALAETACESEAVLEYLPSLPRGCHKQRISAAGALSFGVVQSPERLARKAWEHQVIFFFGERYLDWEKAACKKVFCVRASFAGSRRCSYSAFPCASDTDPAALEALSTRQIAPREVRIPRRLPRTGSKRRGWRQGRCTAFHCHPHPGWSRRSGLQGSHTEPRRRLRPGPMSPASPRRRRGTANR